MKNVSNKNQQHKSKTKAQAMTEVLFILMEIIMVIAASLLVTSKINNIDDSQVFLKKYFTRDLPITIDALQVLQGNVLYIYRPTKETMSNLDFKFSKTTIEAGDEKYPVAVRNIEDTLISKPQQITFIKQNKKFSVTKETIQWNPYTLTCPETKTSSLGKVIIDAGHGFNAEAKDYTGDVGFEGSQGKESTLMANLALNLMTNLKLLGVTVSHTRNPTSTPEDAKSTNTRKELTKNSDTIISLHLNDDYESINNLKAYVNFESDKYLESTKLACMVLNELSDDLVSKTTSKITGTAIVPVSLKHLNDDDAKQILDANKVAVYFELGNVNNNKMQIKEIDMNKISKAIVNYQK